MIHLKLLSETAEDFRFAIYDADVYVGGITVYPINPETAAYGILICSTFRQQGYGKTALGCLFDLLAARGFNRIRARVESGNIPSLSLHRSLGFVQTGTEMGGKVLVFERPAASPCLP